MKKIIALSLIIVSTCATSSYGMFSRMTRTFKFTPRTTLQNGRLIIYSPEQQFLDRFDKQTSGADERFRSCFELEEAKLTKEAIKEQLAWGTNPEKLQREIGTNLLFFTDKFIFEESEERDFLRGLSKEERSEYIETIKQDIEQRKKEILAQLAQLKQSKE